MDNPSLHGHIQSPHHSERLADPRGVPDTSESFVAYLHFPESGDTLTRPKQRL